MNIVHFIIIAVCVSVLSKLFQTMIFHSIASEFSAHLRYDIFYCFFKKCSTKTLQIDKE